jgi:hypothetical protein
MSCKTYELKLDKSHLSNENLHALYRLFLEAKWFYNAMLASPGGHFAFDYKQKDVVVLNKATRTRSTPNRAIVLSDASVYHR